VKILYLINYAGKAGTEKYVREIAEFSQKQGTSVFFAYNIHGPLAEHFQERQIPSFQLTMRHPFDIKAARILANICKKHKVDIIHAQYARENYIAILAKIFGSGAHVVFTSHFHINNNFLWRCTNRIFTRANGAIIAVCNSIKDLLVKNKVYPKKIYTVFNGVAPSYSPRPLPPLPFTFVTIGRLSPEKGLMFLLASVKLLTQTCTNNFKVLIAGDGEMLQQIENYISDHKLSCYVELLGYCDPVPVLQKSHVYIGSSQSEGISYSVLEAMSQSLPVIATNLGGFPDIVNNKTNCGILVEYGDKEALANAMETIMNDDMLYNQLSQNTLRTIESIFNIQTMANLTYNIYKELMSNDRQKR